MLHKGLEKTHPTINVQSTQYLDVTEPINAIDKGFDRLSPMKRVKKGRKGPFIYVLGGPYR